MGIKKHIFETYKLGRKGYFVLLDPEKNEPNYASIIKFAERCDVNGIMIGGSSDKIDNYNQFVDFVIKRTSIPIIAFPGSHYQISSKFDSIFLLTLLNSRNPKFLIDEHYQAADMLYKSNIDIINTAYVIISKSRNTSVVRETCITPIDSDDNTAISRYMKLIEIMNYDIAYLEAGSGSKCPIALSAIAEARSILKKPIIAGGGIRDLNQAEQILKSGADFIVTGHIIEQKPELICDFKHLIDRMNNGQIPS